VWSVSLSPDGTTVAVGAYLHNSGRGQTSIYRWDSTSWVQIGLKINGTNIGDGLGYSVSLSDDGNTIAIGAPFTSSDSGSTHVYRWNGTSWEAKGLEIIGEGSDDTSGHSVSLSSDGNAVAIGSPAINSCSDCGNTGRTRVYTWDGTIWSKKGIDINGATVSERSGFSVSLSFDGNTVAIGAPFNGDSAPAKGKTVVHSWDGSSWVEKGSDIKGEADGDSFGHSVSLSYDGNTVAIGAPQNIGNGSIAEPAGHIRVYRWNSLSWEQLGLGIDGATAGDNFGVSVSLSTEGNTVAIGAPQDGSIVGSGYTNVYEWNGASWVLKNAEIDGEAIGDKFGISVSLSSDGNIVAVGASDGGSTSGGRVQIFKNVFLPLPDLPPSFFFPPLD